MNYFIGVIADENIFQPTKFKIKSHSSKCDLRNQNHPSDKNCFAKELRGDLDEAVR
jgi:hypothetical protein